MAKNFNNNRNQPGTENSHNPKSGKVVELTQKKVAETIDVQKERQKDLEETKELMKDIEKDTEAEKAKLEKLEKSLIAAEKEVDKEIEHKKAEVKELKTSSKKEKKWDLNPLNWIRHIGTRALSGVVGLPSRTAAKIKHIVARPQQLASKQFYGDLWKNLLRTPKAILTTISGAVYKPHRDIAKFEDNFKDYGPEFANPTDKNAIVRNGKKALWYAGKVAVPVTGGLSLMPKFFANIGRGMNHAIHETFEGIRDSKFHWNPMKRNLKPWKFAKTREAFGKAFSWNKKGKTVDVTHLAHKEHKKAA